MDLYTNQTHYFVVYDGVAGLVRADWKIFLFKNGELTQSVPVEVRESSVGGFYTFSFVNDGTSESQWTLIVTSSAGSGDIFTQHWRVLSRMQEQTLRLLRINSETQRQSDKQ